MVEKWKKTKDIEKHWLTEKQRAYVCISGNMSKDENMLS